MKLLNKFLSIIAVPTRKTLKESQKASNSTVRKASEADKIAVKLASGSKGKNTCNGIKLYNIMKATNIYYVKVTKRLRKNPITLDPTIIDSNKTEQYNTATHDKMDRTVNEIINNADKSAQLSKNDITSYKHLMKGLKTCLTQNRKMFQVIYDIKNEQKEFYKETHEQLNELLEKVDQLMIPEDLSDDNAFQKVFEDMLEQKNQRCDKVKDICTAMFNVFGEDWLVRINITASADDICSFKQSHKTKKAFKCLFEANEKGNLLYIQAIKNKAWISIDDNSLQNRFNTYLDCLINSKEITVNTTKHIRLMELCKVNDSDSSDSSDDEENLENHDQELENCNQDDHDIINQDNQELDN
ncbi:hypothetical protein GLOIN_2v1484278 [Rhizophagus clarus]|uniref:Uncharacterized protein n=1 Tax=Rhizophagus clarus TaxID=94130 RepID=A0A8H3KRT7_9GLOM|nr:hypothetical protein GLOIN_2v1484278 [Rhizophagus clarus]